MAVIDTTFISDEELLEQVKASNDYGENTYADKKLSILIRGVKEDMRASGLPDQIVNSVSVVDIIALSVDALLRKEEPLPYVKEKITKLRMGYYE